MLCRPSRDINTIVLGKKATASVIGIRQMRLTDDERSAAKSKMFAPIQDIAEAKKSPVKKVRVSMKARVTSVGN